MEVHAHTHPSTSSGHRKKWTHYFWEFLMLFLAVFSGFLAENFREHQVEHQREKRFAKQLLADLRTDSVSFSLLLNKTVPQFEKNTRKLNDLLTRNPPATDNEIIGTIFNIKRVGLQFYNTTFLQMKTSGTLRYIRNDSLTKLLSIYYDGLCSRVLYSWEESRDFYNKYLQPFHLKHIRSQDFLDQSDSVRIQNSKMIDRTQITDQEILNYINSYNIQVTGSLIENKCKPAYEVIIRLIPLLKKEYHLN